MLNITGKLFKNGRNAKVVVVTGASAGVGRATVREFAKKKYKIGLIARGEEGLNETKQEVEDFGGQAIVIPADVADAQQMENAAARVEETFGPIDIWVNNAMTSVFSPVKDMQPEEYRRVTEVTYLGQVYGTLAALKRMLPRNKGSIVLVGSALAYRGIPLQSSYCAAKHATQGFFDSLRTELLHDKSNVNVTMVQLPALNTPQFSWVKSRLPQKARPMGKIYQPEVAAKAIVYASEHKRREMYVGTTTIQAIVGNKLFPWLGDLVLAKNGFKGQQTDEPENPQREHNLWEPVKGKHKAHGDFDDQATDKSPELWLSMNKRKLGAGILAGAVATGTVWAMAARKKKELDAVLKVNE